MSALRAPLPFAARSLAFAGLLILVGITACALFAPWIAPADPLAIDPPARLSAPGAEHWFGTDHFGRDTLSRVIHGSRMAVFIGVVYLTTTSRIVYGVTLRLNSEAWVEGARGMGAGTARIVFRHLLPNLMSPLFVQASFVFAFAQLQAASLDFLGLGVPPETPTWGNMLSESRVYITRAPWLLLFPGLMIALSAFSLNLIGDALRDRLDPRLQDAFSGRRR